MTSERNQPRIVVFEPFSTYVALRVLSILPVVILSIMWIAAYSRPRRFSSSWISLGLFRLWIHTNRLIESYVFFPYARHPSVFLAVAIAATIITGYFLFRAVITPDRTTWLLFKLILPPIAIVSSPFIVQGFSVDARKAVWWEITLVILITGTALIHHLKRIRKETTNVR